jgi:hypothetical protein
MRGKRGEKRLPMRQPKWTNFQGEIFALVECKKIFNRMMAG